MQSRRHEDYPSETSYGRGRRNINHSPDSYLKMSPHSKRSWSPRRLEHPSYSDRELSRLRSPPVERRRIIDDGSRRIRSRSPPFLDSKRVRPFYNDDWVVDRDLPTSERQSRYDFFNHMDMKHGDVDSSPTRTHNHFTYGRGSSRPPIIDDKFEDRRLDSGINEIVTRKPAFTGLYRSTREVGPTSRPQSSKDLSSTSLNIGIDHPDNTRGSFSYDKYTSMKQYGDEDKHMVLVRDPTYPNLEGSRSKEALPSSHFKDYARTSPQKSRMDQLGYRSEIPLSRDNHLLNSSNTSHNHLSPSMYEEPRQHLQMNHGRDPYLEYNESAFSPPRTRNLDSLHFQSRTRERDDYLYPSDDIYEKMDLHERVDYRGMDMDRNRDMDRDILKPKLLEHQHVTQRVEASDFVHRNMNSRSSMDYLSLPVTHNIDKREHTQFLDNESVHTRIGRKISREQDIPYMGMGQEREMGHVRVDYDYKQDLGTEFHKERRRESPRFLYEMERVRPSERSHKMEERYDLSPYDSSSRFIKRKYTIDDEENRVIPRRQYQDYSDEEWIEEEWVEDQEIRGSNYRKRRDYIHDHDEYIHDHHKYEKGYLRSGGYNTNYQNKKHFLSKSKNVSRSSEMDKDMYFGEMEQHEEWSNNRKSEPREGSDAFKKLSHEYFLNFTKKLNENSSVRRRYMEQGKAGSLFCIVCGRSLSKEFMDTQRLAMHAFMSRKVGLRAQHLGLHKALCYMLGWNGNLPQDTSRWLPESLSNTESLKQKEDLIIWPPVVIVHNISILNNDQNGKGKGPTSEEELGQFLRGKGLSSGKGKVTLGKNGNCSVMLVKFLGTFSGLQEAEKIHEYFVKGKHGRKYYEQIVSGKGKGKDNGENGNEEREGERVLFGYMGIAEDLDKVDFDTKRKCVIKSKKDIKDIADAPVKAE